MMDAKRTEWSFTWMEGTKKKRWGKHLSMRRCDCFLSVSIMFSQFVFPFSPFFIIIPDTRRVRAPNSAIHFDCFSTGCQKKKVKTLHFKENVYAKLVRRHGNAICQDRFSISALFSVSVNDNKQAGEIVKIDKTGAEREREWASGIYDKQLERGHPSPELRAYGTRKKKKKNRKGGGCFVSCNTDRIV